MSFKPVFVPRRQSKISENIVKTPFTFPRKKVAIIGVIFLTLFFFVLFFFSPDQVKDLFYRDSYISIVMVLLVSQFFIWASIFKSYRRGLLFGIFLSLIFSFRLHQMLSVIAMGIILIPLLLIEIILTIGKTK